MKKLFLALALLATPVAAAAPQALTKNYLIGGWVMKGEHTCEDDNLYMVFRPDGRWQWDMDSGTYKVLPRNKIMFDGKDLQTIRIVDRNTYVTTWSNGTKQTMLRCPINWDNVHLDG